MKGFRATLNFQIKTCLSLLRKNVHRLQALGTNIVGVFLPGYTVACYVDKLAWLGQCFIYSVNP